MRKLLIGLLVLAAASFAGWYFGSPVWTLYQISEAAKARDTDRLSVYVDYPALRQSFSSELRARYQRRIDAQETGMFQRLRARAALALTDRAAAAAVNPTTVRLMFTASEAAERVRPPVRVEPMHAELVRDGFSTFRMRADNGGALIFERRGLGWQLAGIRLPPEAEPAPQAEEPGNAATAATIAG